MQYQLENILFKNEHCESWIGLSTLKLLKQFEIILTDKHTIFTCMFKHFNKSLCLYRIFLPKYKGMKDDSRLLQ